MFKFVELKFIVLFLIISSLLLISNSGWAEEAKGKVVKIKSGKLESFADGKWKEIKKDSAVSLGDRLRTDKNSFAVIDVPNIGRFVIGPDSEIELGKETKEFKGNLPRGAVWMNSSLPKGKKASITTTLATAGIRGTIFTVWDDGEEFYVCTCSGEVEVTLNSGQIIKVSKGEYMEYELGHAPEKPHSVVSKLEKGETDFNFCFNCHTAGTKGKLKTDWKKEWE